MNNEFRPKPLGQDINELFSMCEKQVRDAVATESTVHANTKPCLSHTDHIKAQAKTQYFQSIIDRYGWTLPLKKEQVAVLTAAADAKKFE